MTLDPIYTLPPEKIAIKPPKKRGTSRLLVLNRLAKHFSDQHYFDLPHLLKPGDLLILNNSKVIKARLEATTPHGGKRELLLLERHHDFDPHRSQALYHGKLRPGAKLDVAGHTIKIIKLKDGIATIASQTDLYQLADLAGQVPLPPYLNRDATPEDTARYQTTFAKQKGSVAAPTASLNFTAEIKNNLSKNGVNMAELTLHVGLGTFRPIKVCDLKTHHMHQEYYTIPQQTIDLIRETKARGDRVIALGTTVTRALEHAAPEIFSKGGEDRGKQGRSARRSNLNEDATNDRGEVSSAQAGPAKNNSISAEADIFIYPGYKFQVINGLLTNFHAPDSTVIQLTSAFAGTELLKKAYHHALDHNYRFLSYGDSMLIL